MIFNNDIRIRGNPLPNLPTQEEIKHIPQFYRADADMVWRLGGNFLREFIYSAPPRPFKYIILDVKVHMLMPSWFPCIPGWHCDDFYRPKDNTPDLLNYRRMAPSTLFMVVVGNSSFTEFLKGPIELPSPEELPKENKPIYGTYNRIIDSMIEENKAEIISVKSGVPVEFTGLDFHRGTVTEKATWRLFARITMSNHRPPVNEIRTQSQVYMPQPFNGW
jgi:hypothetical protein